MFANYIIDDNTVYEIDEECCQESNRCQDRKGKANIEQEQVTFSAYI